MPASSENATDTNSVKVGDLLVWFSDDGRFWDNFGQSVNPNLKVMVMGEDGKRMEVTGPGAIPLMTELKRLADAAKA